MRHFIQLRCIHFRKLQTCALNGILAWILLASQVAWAQEDADPSRKPNAPQTSQSYDDPSPLESLIAENPELELQNASDPLSFIAKDAQHGLSEADKAAQDAATYLRIKALNWYEERRAELEGDQEDLAALDAMLKQGNCRYELEKNIGTVRISKVDNSYAFKIVLNQKRFPNTAKTVFLVFSMDDLAIDPRKAEIVMTTLFKADFTSATEKKALLKDPELLETYIIEAASREGFSATEVLTYLRSESAHLRKYISKLLMESDVQALGLNENGETAFALFKQKPKINTLEFWTTWWNANKESVSWGSATVGFICGSIQGIATYYMELHALNALADYGVASPFAAEVIPYVAAAWSFSYGFTMGLINGFYRNVTYSGTDEQRVVKLSFFGALFSFVYKGISDTRALITLDGQVHMWTNILVNQYAKDDAYRTARFRDQLRLSTKKMKLPVGSLISAPVKKAFPIFQRIPSHIDIKQADFETQASYHVLWALKMLHFLKLMPVAVIPAAIGVARVASYAYMGFHLSSLNKKFKTEPTPELAKAIESTKKHLNELNKSWLHVATIPYRVMNLAHKLWENSGLQGIEGHALHGLHSIKYAWERAGYHGMNGYKKLKAKFMTALGRPPVESVEHTASTESTDRGNAPVEGTFASFTGCETPFSGLNKTPAFLFR